MGDKSAIEWTDASWNVIRGCSRVSEGCRNCYAERMAIRQKDAGYYGLIKSTPQGPRWTGEVNFVEHALDLPLRWKRPRRVFVNSMGDLFHEKVPDEWIDKVLARVYAAPQHTYQVLTKRPERMRAFMAGAQPPDNLWLGVSVEDQATADERIPLLLQTPAAVRWVSYEPALGPVDFEKWLAPCSYYCDHDQPYPSGHRPERSKLDWLVVGGESGPGARPFDLAWARSTIAQGQAAGVPVFVKQLGLGVSLHTTEIARGRYVYDRSRPGDRFVRLNDRKGGDPAEWPEDLRVREFPR